MRAEKLEIIKELVDLPIRDLRKRARAAVLKVEAQRDIACDPGTTRGELIHSILINEFDALDINCEDD